MPREFWIVGPGRLGLSLAAVLARSTVGHKVVIVGRHQPPPLPEAPVGRLAYHAGLPSAPPAGACAVLAVPDGAVTTAAAQLAAAGSVGAGCAALHLSGALDSSALGSLAERGYATGSVHPLQTIADPSSGPERLRGAFFTFEGDGAARPAAEDIIAAAEGRLLELTASDKPRYHAACVFASNYLVTCAAVATRLLATAVGVDEGEAARALAPLWRGSIENLEELGLPAALTGPVARGDVDTVRANLAALAGADRELYRRLALVALEIGRRAGLAPERATALEAALGPGGGSEAEGE